MNHSRPVGRVRLRRALDGFEARLQRHRPLRKSPAANQKAVAFAEANLGQKVGRGECADLAEAA